MSPLLAVSRFLVLGSSHNTLVLLVTIIAMTVMLDPYRLISILITVIVCSSFISPSLGKCSGKWATQACAGGNGKRLSEPRHDSDRTKITMRDVSVVQDVNKSPENTRKVTDAALKRKQVLDLDPTLVGKLQMRQWIQQLLQRQNR